MTHKKVTAKNDPPESTRGFIIFQTAPRSIIQEESSESKRASLIIMPLNLLEEEQAEKLKRMAA